MLSRCAGPRVPRPRVGGRIASRPPARREVGCGAVGCEKELNAGVHVRPKRLGPNGPARSYRDDPAYP